MTPLETLRLRRVLYPTPMRNDQLGELLNAVAWAHRDEGYGVLSKPHGANCRQPRTGELISRDILVLPDGRIFDCLVDAEGKATPTWGEKTPVAANRWRAPVDAIPGGFDHPDPDDPDRPEPPVTHAQPYPSEAAGEFWEQFEREQEDLYRQADNPLDWAAFRWSARTAYDIGAGMEKEASKAKHLAELRAALGL